MANINIVPGLNVITYRGSSPINFSAIANFDANILFVKTPDCKVRAGGIVYQNFQSYFPGAGPLNDWLTYFGAISSYIVLATNTFTITEQGNTVTPQEAIVVPSPLGLVGIDTNRVDTVPVSNSDNNLVAVYWFDSVISQWRLYSPGAGPLNNLNNTGDARTNNWIPGRTYYIVSKPGTPIWYLNINRINDYLLADNNDFLRTDNDDNLCV